MIEMRSDTFSLPSKKMLKSILYAELGDDVYGEDPTVKKLELMSADMLGKEAAILMPSGTMANLASILAHCPRGSRVIVGDESDIYLYEAGGAAICGGIIYEAVRTQIDGSIEIKDIIHVLPQDINDPQFSIPKLICIENPNNRMGGIPLSTTYSSKLYNFAKKRGMKLHVDGARIFNAATALNTTAKKIAKYCDSLQFCLSKSLSAPIGSIVVGDKKFIQDIHRIRKMLGGGMRQAGIIAAPAIYSMNSFESQLITDHENTKILFEGLSKIPGIILCSNKPYTNMVFFKIDRNINHFIKSCKGKGLNVGELGYNRISVAVHSGITKKDVIIAIKIISEVMKDMTQVGKLKNYKPVLIRVTEDKNIF